MSCQSYDFWFLADCTLYGRANANRLCVRRLSVTLCIVAKRRVLEQKLLLTAHLEVVYEKSIGIKMNDRDLRLEVVSRSR